ncbi:PREDICTED: putative histone-lysine N-methyltransferase 1 [Cyphomyrmex costatus]|uniref:putative histone-lysine N-methyltransferase 1 n=1 Tax=Cyphomyrmex costatus TaxID=456900 RepID=UPI0008523DF3|nr:PREDICTED: putative histone-lysine N-methyltransferase 1 [Cyphomyrmex costatus]
MFLNDLKNRLQPHAIPEPMRNDNESSVNDATFNLNDKSEENTSISDNNNHLINNVYEEDHVESVLHVQHQYTQTESKISNHSPRKNILRGRIIALHREIRKLKQQLQRQTNNIKICARKISLEEYCEATNEFLSPQVANFVKTQLKFKSRVHSTEGHP